MASQQYENSSCIPNKILNANGSVTMVNGSVPANPCMQWLNAKPIPNKMLNPDGSVSEFDFGSGPSGSWDGGVGELVSITNQEILQIINEENKK